MHQSSISQRVGDVRRFNRAYTRHLGLLQQGYLRSPFSLTQVRVLYELAHHDAERITATELARQLDLDAGYLSRILDDFGRQGLLERQRAEHDARQSLLRLSPRGREVFAPLDAGANEQIAALLARLPDDEQVRLLQAMSTIEAALGGHSAAARVPYILRPPQAGDMGWVVARHGALYAHEFGFDAHFEALVAGIVARFVRRFDPARERCWIAERNAQPVGCVFLVRGSKTIGKLRLFLVEPSARGLGIGTRLVDECIRFARAAGYRRIRLWTQSNLLAARRIYERAGFVKIDQEAHHSWSKDLVSETWELRLQR